MKRLITAAILSATSLLTIANISASATTRPVVVYEPIPTSHHFKGVVRPRTWNITIGPSTQFRRSHWSSWGRKTAIGFATMYVIDFGTHNEGRAKLELYRVRKYKGMRYFSRLSIKGAKTENGVWQWCVNDNGEWQGQC
jgi:hypothetical protein